MIFKSTRTITLAVLALTLLLAGSIRSWADESIEPDFEGQKTTVDKQDRLHLEATASLNAPVDKVYNALSQPDKVAKYDAQVTGVKVISQSGNSKIVEFKGRTLPIPNSPPALDVKYIFDPSKKVIKSESYGKAPVPFQTETALSPSKDGKSTEIKYTSVSGSTAKLMGFDPPQFMRQQFALDAFMRGLRNAGLFIAHGGK